MHPHLKLFKLILLGLFAILICICTGAEIYQIVYKRHVYWSDTLHNLVDHIVYVMVNYIAIMTVLRKSHH